MMRKNLVKAFLVDNKYTDKLPRYIKSTFARFKLGQPVLAASLLLIYLPNFYPNSAIFIFAKIVMLQMGYFQFLAVTQPVPAPMMIQTQYVDTW